MKPEILDTSFGKIVFRDKTYHHDVYIHPDGQVSKRKKKISKKLYGTSHKIAVDEIRNIYVNGLEKVIVGSGQFGVAGLSPEANEFLEKKGCRLYIDKTPEAVREWNRSEGRVSAIFHLTC